jgi:hypothetical protein
MENKIKKIAIEQLETINKSLESERPDKVKKALIWAREMTQQSINRRSDVRSQLHFLVQGATHLGRAKALAEIL